MGRGSSGQGVQWVGSLVGRESSGFGVWGLGRDEEGKGVQW